MYTVKGKVLVKETGIGIPNLQIVLYDLDQQQGREFYAAFSNDQAREMFSFSMAGQPAQLFWQNFPGDRLGSVLTSERGEFELSFGESSFQDREQIMRPDLVLLVMAPEDTVSNQSGVPLSQSPVQRILHFSYDPVVNSGRTENYIIRLPTELLDRFQIPHATPYIPAPPAPESYKTILQESFEMEQGFRAAFTQQIQARAKPALDAKRRTDEAFRNFSLSSVPANVRAGLTYLNPGEPLEEKQNQLVDDQLATIPGLDQAANVNRRLTLHLSEEQLADLDLAPGQDGTVSGEVELPRLLDFVKRATDTSQLDFSQPVLGSCSKRREARRLFDEAEATCAPTPDTSDEPRDDSEEPESEEPEITAERLIDELIARQTAHVTAPEEELSYGVERDGKIIATITTPGPAEVTAYHDFQELHIAFEHVWAEATDGKLPLLLKEAYSEMVRYKNRVSGTDESPEVTDVSDMRDLYHDHKLLRQEIENESNSQPAEENALVPVPPKVKIILPDISNDDFSHMEPAEQTELIRLAEEFASLSGYDFLDFLGDLSSLGFSAGLRKGSREIRKGEIRQAANEILNNAKARRELEEEAARVQAASRAEVHIPSNRLDRLMGEIDQRLGEPYKFDIFAKDSINFAIMLVYLQAWTPKNYQVGDLVSTLPLAPKEVRRYTTKRVVKKTRAQKEIEDSQSSRRIEASSTARADTEIVRRATNKTSFEQTAEGTLSLGMFEGRFGTKFGVDAEKASSSTKKNFREAISKATEEYKQQNRLEIETTTSEEIEITDYNEITNPNDEITVTYLFYELQRQYEVSEKIHRLTPVVLVANEVPNPDDIDEDWLITNDWWLRRVILDDTFLLPLDYVTANIAGDELVLQELRGNVRRQAKLVDETITQLQKKTELADSAFAELKRITGLIEKKEDFALFTDLNLALAFGPFALAGMGGNDEAAEKREEIAKMAIERADKEVQQVNARLAREVAALQEALDKYTTTLREHLDQQIAIARLRIHIKENILYYMQAKWDYEHPHARFLRLYNIRVPWIELIDTTVTATMTGRPARRGGLRISPVEYPLFELEATVPLRGYRRTEEPLSKIADLDNLLGYFGNYMIFPVREPNFLHIYMMQDYIDPRTGGLRDPDDYANYTTQELLDYICCLKETEPELFEENRVYLLHLLGERMASPRKESELVVVPTDSLYIEALAGKHPILEDFKLVHRALDVKKVQAEVRSAELENARLAARLLVGEREDPTIEKRIQIDGADDIIVDTE